MSRECERKHTAQVEIRAQSLHTYPSKSSFYSADSNLPDGIFKPYTLDGVVITKSLEILRPIDFPEGRESTSVQQCVQPFEDR